MPRVGIGGTWYGPVGLFLATTLFISSWAKADTIGVEETVVFDGLQGWEHEGVTYRLAVGGNLMEMPNGDILCWWLSGTDTEPSSDNNVLASRSTDRGVTWSEPYVFLKAGDEAAAGGPVFVTDQSKVIAFGARWPAEFEYTIWHLFRMESVDNGHTWSAPVDFHLRPEDNLAAGRPMQLHNGEYLMAASVFEKRSVPLRGPIKALANASTEAEALAVPLAPDGAKPDKFMTHLHGTSVLTTSDPELRGWVEHATIRNRPLGLLEGTAIQLKDDRIVMLMRAEYGGFLWRAESSDNGRTWTDAWQTDIPDPTSLASLIRLPDGRIALLHNASGGVVGERARRDPLSIWVSDDEMETWYLKCDVITGGYLSYPCPIIVDGALVFGYDHNRRQVRFVRVDLPPVRGEKAP